MTISTTISSQTFNGDGVSTTFMFTFEIPFQSDGVTPAILVFITSPTGVVTNLTYGVDYTATGIGSPDDQPGGTVTYPANADPTLPSGWTITIQRNVFLTQPFAFPNTNFLPEDVETLGDWLEMQIQDLAGDLAQATIPTSPVQPLFTQNSNFVLAQNQGGGLVLLGNAAATVPPNSTVPFPIGVRIDFIATNATPGTIAAGAGVTINSVGGSLTISAQWAAVSLTQTAANVWSLTGSLA